jgi:hypothetical protein
VLLLVETEARRARATVGRLRVVADSQPRRKGVAREVRDARDVRCSSSLWLGGGVGRECGGAEASGGGVLLPAPPARARPRGGCGDYIDL